MDLRTPLTEATGIAVPLIAGAMYPCSNPELVAAASEAVDAVEPVGGGVYHDVTEGSGLRSKI